MKIFLKGAALIILLAAFPMTSQGQTLTDTTMLVNGVCQMCEFTIESTSLKVEGVQSASWDVESKVLTLTYDAQLTNLMAINEAINASGYDTEYQTADEESYRALAKCCYYRDPQVVKEHENH